MLKTLTNSKGNQVSFEKQLNFPSIYSKLKEIRRQNNAILFKKMLSNNSLV